MSSFKYMGTNPTVSTNVTGQLTVNNTIVAGVSPASCNSSISTAVSSLQNKTSFDTAMSSFTTQSAITTALAPNVLSTKLAAASGIATLDSTGNIPSSQLGNISNPSWKQPQSLSIGGGTVNADYTSGTLHDGLISSWSVTTPTGGSYYYPVILGSFEALPTGNLFGRGEVYVRFNGYVCSWGAGANGAGAAGYSPIVVVPTAKSTSNYTGAIGTVTIDAYLRTSFNNTSVTLAGTRFLTLFWVRV